MARDLFINTRWMIGGHHVLEEVASCRRETVTFVLSVQVLGGLQRPTECARVSPPNESGPYFRGLLQTQPRPPENLRARQSV